MTAIYKIRKDAFKELRKKMLLRSIPVLLFSIILSIAMSIFNSDTRIYDDYSFLAVTILVMVLAISAGIYVSIKKQQKFFDSYTLTIADNTITREQFNTPTIAIHLFEIKDIVKQSNDTITIRGERDLIIIPKQIENYQELETRLNTIQEIGSKDNTSFYQKYQGLAGIVSAGLMYCVYVVEDKLIVAITGTLLIGWVIWSFVQIRRNNNIDNSTKRNMWLRLIIMVIVIATMINKLTGFPLLKLLTS